MWDVFISHAWEDKEEVARPLAEALQEEGLSVWYDELTLTLGDSLRRKIDDGLAKSRFGIIILSQDFFRKDWPQRELDGLTTKETKSGKAILPVWHRVTHDEVAAFSPILADKLGISTARGLNIIVKEILRVVRPGQLPRLPESQTIPLDLPEETRVEEALASIRDSRIQMASSMAKMAEKHLLAGRRDEAIQNLTDCLKLMPDDADLLILRADYLAIRAHVQGELARYDEAIQDATAALEIEPKHANALHIRAETMRLLGRYDEAIRDATAALEIDAKKTLALIVRAEAYRQTGQWDKAIRDAEAALKLEPGNTLAQNTLEKALVAKWR